MARVIHTRRYSFQSVHSLEVGAMRERTHGHHYSLEVSFENVAVAQIDQLVRHEILAALHGQQIKSIYPSTGEKIVEWIDQRLRTHSAVVAVALQETRKNRFVSTESEAAYV